MFCEKCGSQNNDGAKFCAICGALMEQGAPQSAPEPANTPEPEQPAYTPAPEPAPAAEPAPAYTQQTYAPAYTQPGYAPLPRKRDIATPSKIMLILCSVFSVLSMAMFFIPFTFSKESEFTTKFYNIISIFGESFKADLSRANGIVLLIMFIIASIAALAAVILAVLRFKAAGAMALVAAVFAFGLNFNYFFGFIGYIFNMSTYEMYGSGYTPVPLVIFILSVIALVISAMALSKYRLKK